MHSEIRLDIMRIHFLLLLLVAISWASCKQNAPKPLPETEPTIMPSPSDWAKNANIYEVNIRQYTATGTINAFREGHLQRLKDMGVDILWLMPIYPISETKRKGTLGSYYAVSDFRKVNPAFGTMQDMEALLKEAHALGMKVILDWVPNHTGWDHVWIKEHPDYYTQINGEITDPVNSETGESWGWTDVADLNYDNADMRAAMIADLLFWVEEKGIDGFRMDVASEVPLSFWETAIPKLRAAKPDIFMLAEAEVPEHRNTAELFDMSYGWSFHHLMNAIAQGKDSIPSIATWLEQDRERFKQGHHMHFITNHDENSWNGTVQERMGKAADAMAVLAFTFDGMPLLYSGQEAALDKRLRFFEKDTITWDEYPKATFYEALLDLKHRNPAIWNGTAGGQLQQIPVDNPSIYAYFREQGENRVLVLLNLSNASQNMVFSHEACEGLYSDVFTGQSVDVENGQTISLGAWAYQVLELQL